MVELLADIGQDAFISAVPGPTGNAIAEAAKNGADLNAFADILAAEPIAAISPKGIAAWPPDLGVRVRQELCKLICTDDPCYAETRKRLLATGGVAALVVVNTAAAAIAASLGLAPALLMPLVGTLLAAAAKVGVKAWCSGQSAAPPAVTLPPAPQRPPPPSE